MRGAAILLLAIAVPVSAQGPRPMRVMSLNQCTDQLVLALLPPERIASVTWLARDPAGSLMAARARAVPVNRGRAEEVVRTAPDLVIAGRYTTPATRALLTRLGYPLIEVDPAENFADIRRVTRQVAAAVGARARGEALIARMDRQLAALARAPVRPVRVAAWDGAGFGARTGSLFDAVLGAARAINIANQPPATAYRIADTEVLLAAAPRLLVQGMGAGPGLGEDSARHPVVRRRWKGRTLTIRPAYYVCGTPFAADAALALRREIRTATKP